MVRTLLRLCLGALLAGAVAALVAFKRGWIAPAPAVLAGLAGGVVALLAVELVLTGYELRRVGARLGTSGRALALAGGVAMGAGGLANWLLSLQGFAVLIEREAVPLFRGAHLEGFEAGPLANPAELNAIVQLEELVLRPVADGFLPESRLTLIEEGAAPRSVTLGTGEPGVVGSLRLRQGAFGFAPRLVVLRGDETLLDRSVPFETRRVGARGVVFEGAVDVPEHGLTLTGAISLDTLNAELRGHPVLGVRVEREGVVIGAGELRPGHFAELEGGYRVGLAGVWRWSEIDVARRNYATPVRLGAVASAAGLLLWAGASLRRRRGETS